METSKFKQISHVFLGIGIGLFGGAMLWAKAAPQEPKAPEVIRAQRFEVVDADGKVTAEFGQIPVGPEHELSTGVMLGRKDTKGVTMIFSAPDGTQHLMMTDINHLTGIDMRRDENAEIRMINGKQKKDRTLKP